MRQIRGYLDSPLSPGAIVALDERLAHHLTRVLRLGDGAPVTLFNGDGHDYPAVLLGGGRKGMEARVDGRESGIADSPLQLTLAQGLCRGEKMDLILQKATELGVAAFQPLSTERSEVRLSGEREAKRIAHWSQVIVSACEQCGRSRLPALAAPLPLATWMGAGAAEGMRLMLDPEAPTSLVELAPPMRVALAVGPEGGFSPHEREMLERAGFQRARLGPRILRTETAGFAAIAILQGRAGDLR